MADSTTIFTPENGGFGTNGWGGGILGFLLGVLLGNGGAFGNWGGFGGGNSGAAGFLSNQMNNDNGRDLLMSAITSSGEASRSAIENLANTLGQDFNLVNSGVQGIRDAVGSLSAQTGMSSLQIINAIQSGNAALSSQLCNTCCEMQNLVNTQGYQAQIRTLEQTNALASQADRNANAIIGAINNQTIAMNDGFCAIKERELQDKIDSLTAANTVLRGQIDNLNQTNTFAAMLAPIQAQIASLVAKAPATVPVVWPQLTVTQTTPTTGA